MRKKKLLIVVDMQNDFITGTLGSKDAQKIVPNVVEKIKKWKGVVQATFDQHDKNYLNTLEGKKLPIVHCIEYTSGGCIHHDIVEVLKERGVWCRGKDRFGDYSLFSKLAEEDHRETLTFSVVDGTLVEEYKSHISEIQIVGLHTDTSVISNAILAKSYFPETPIIVDASCCSGTTLYNHKAALKIMESCQIDVINK